MTHVADWDTTSNLDRVNQVHPYLEVVITSAMPSELTGFELSKLDLLDKKSRSLPPCFHEVTVAPKRLLLAVPEGRKRPEDSLMSFGVKTGS